MEVSPATILSLSLTIPPPSFLFSGDTLRFNRYVSCNQSFSRPDRLGLVVAEKPSRRRWTFCFKCRNRRGNGYPKSEALEEGEDFVVVNFYRFVSIEDPEAEISNHLSFLQDLNIRGRIYLNEQGINAQYSGPSKDALAYVEWIKEDERFSDILVQMSPAINGHAFPKLKLQKKPSLVQYEGGISQLPLLDPPMRAKPLEPSEWKRKLKDLTDNDEASSSSGGRSCILLDVRNGLLKPAEVFGGDRHFFILIGYEWDVGHFRGACRPEVDCFRNTTFGLSDEKEVPSDPLINVDKENTDILMYCTGGIRCDVYSTVLRQRGFKNLYTLKGGVSHYLEEEGTTEWVGNLFVFDSRLSLPPAAYSNNTMDEEATPTPETTVDTSFARCYICDSQIQELRHRNCANLDCNLLFLCCAECVVDMKGCCCSSCIIAPRLRPVLNGIKRYEKWHVYRDS